MEEELSLIETLLRNGRKTLFQKLLKYTDDFEIYSYFVGVDIEIGNSKKYHSPLRSTDDHPSFSFYVPTLFNTRPDEIWFKDHGDSSYGNVLKFVREYAAFHFGLDLNTTKDIVYFIDTSLGLNVFNKDAGEDQQALEKIDRRIFEKYEGTKPIYYQKGRFTELHTNYWKKLYLTIEDLKFFDVIKPSAILDEYGKVLKRFKSTDLVFIYEILDKVKIYSPYATKEFKFRNNCPNKWEYYQGLKQTKGYRTLIITKSMKDVMVFWKLIAVMLGLKIDIIAPAAESVDIDPEFVEIVKASYDNVYVISDFDRAGVIFANRCKKKYGYTPIFVSTERVLVNGKLKVLDKDISDYLLAHELEQTLNLIKSWHLKE